MRGVNTLGRLLGSISALAGALLAGGRKLWRVRLSTMADPVGGSLLVVGCSGAPEAGTMYAGCEIHGVVSAPGVPPTSVQYDGIVRASRWPSPGQVLPVLVDRAAPQRVQIPWGRVPTGRQRAAQQAAQFAERIRQAGMPGDGELPLSDSVAEHLRSVVIDYGAPGRATIQSVRPGERGPGATTFHLTVDIVMDSGQIARGVEMPTRVPNRLAGMVTPGRSVPVRIASVNGGRVVAYQWELG